MKVLIACEFSGAVRDAFTAAGHDATSCDILPSETPGKHYQGDVLDILDKGWDLMIAHPPCTYLTNSGVKHLYFELTPGERAAGLDKRHAIDPIRWQKMEAGAEFFNALQAADIPMKALENPVMHRFGSALTGGRATQYIQPWQFGHAETKQTGLRLTGLPKLIPTDDVKEHMLTLPKKVRNRIHYLSPGPNRWKERSRTYAGVAAAMADQWGKL